MGITAAAKRADRPLGLAAWILINQTGRLLDMRHAARGDVWDGWRQASNVMLKVVMGGWRISLLGGDPTDGALSP